MPRTQSIGGYGCFSQWDPYSCITTGMPSRGTGCLLPQNACPGTVGRGLISAWGRRAVRLPMDRPGPHTPDCPREMQPWAHATIEDGDRASDARRWGMLEPTCRVRGACWRGGRCPSAVMVVFVYEWRAAAPCCRRLLSLSCVPQYFVVPVLLLRLLQFRILKISTAIIS